MASTNGGLALKGKARKQKPRASYIYPMTRRLRLRRRRVGLRDAAELAEQLGVSVEVGQHDDLADLGVLVAVATDRGEAAPPATAAAGAPADVLLAGIAFDDEFLGGAGVDHRQGDVGLALLDVDAAKDTADEAAAAAEQAAKRARRHAYAAAARI